MSRLQTEETWGDQLDRLQAMTDPLQEKWDLSPNDVAAISAALARLDEERRAREAAEARLAEAVEVFRDIHSRGPCPCCGSEGECNEVCRLARVIGGET